MRREDVFAGLCPSCQAYICAQGGRGPVREAIRLWASAGRRPRYHRTQPHAPCQICQARDARVRCLPGSACVIHDYFAVPRSRSDLFLARLRPRNPLSLRRASTLLAHPRGCRLARQLLLNADAATGDPVSHLPADLQRGTPYTALPSLYLHLDAQDPGLRASEALAQPLRTCRLPILFLAPTLRPRLTAPGW